MDKLKKNWKEFLIVFLILFGMNKCTVSCNKGRSLDKANVEIVTKDSTIKVLNDSIEKMNVTIANLNDKNSMLTGFNKQQATSDSLNRAEVNKRIDNLKKVIKDSKRNR